jgi:hypothetical protein
MSSILWGAQISNAARIQQEPTAGEKALAALSALIPAEAITLFTVGTPFFTKTEDGGEPNATTTIVTSVRDARIACAVVAGVAVGMYVFGRYVRKPPAPNTQAAAGVVGAGKGKIVGKDVVRASIPAIAFVAFLMWQNTVIFNAVIPGTLAEASAKLYGILLAGVFGLIALFLGYKLNDE